MSVLFGPPKAADTQLSDVKLSDIESVYSELPGWQQVYISRPQWMEPVRTWALICLVCLRRNQEMAKKMCVFLTNRLEQNDKNSHRILMDRLETDQDFIDGNVGVYAIVCCSLLLRGQEVLPSEENILHAWKVNFLLKTIDMNVRDTEQRDKKRIERARCMYEALRIVSDFNTRTHEGNADANLIRNSLALRNPRELIPEKHFKILSAAVEFLLPGVTKFEPHEHFGVPGVSKSYALHTATATLFPDMETLIDETPDKRSINFDIKTIGVKDSSHQQLELGSTLDSDWIDSFHKLFTTDTATARVVGSDAEGSSDDDEHAAMHGSEPDVPSEPDEDGVPGGSSIDLDSEPESPSPEVHDILFDHGVPDGARRRELLLREASRPEITPRERRRPTAAFVKGSSGYTRRQATTLLERAAEANGWGVREGLWKTRRGRTVEGSDWEKL